MKKSEGFFTKKCIFILVIFYFFLGLTDCSNFFNETGPLEIDYSGLTLTLCWIDDSTGVSSSSTVDFYVVFYRELGTIQWNELSSTKGCKESITITNNDIGYGKFEFAVQAVYCNEQRGGLHSSNDFSAWPSGGWFLNWYMEEF